jgi:FkbM family methyltransferase
MIFLLRIAQKFRLLQWINSSYKLIVNGCQFKVPVKKGIGLDHNRAFEPWMIEVMQTLIPLSNGTFVDVGVNIGQTLIKLRSISQADYIGFEPNQHCVEYVNELITANRFSNTHLIASGIGNELQKAQLHTYYNSKVDSTASLLSDFRPDSPITDSIQVELLGPNELKEILTQQVGVIKIDVEGYEKFVLQGLKQTIEKFRPIMILEILPVYDIKNNNRLEAQQEIASMIKELNYHILRVRKTAIGRLESFDPIVEFGIHSDLKQCDYVLVPDVALLKNLTSWKA